MKIAVWSPTPFAGRKSTNLLLMAMQAIHEDGGEQLVLHVDPKGSGVEHFMLAGRQRTRMMKKKEFGVELLCKWIHCERFTKEMAVNASYTFAEGKLHVLPPGQNSFYEENKTTAEDICGVMQWADEVFQNVWIELPAGQSDIVNKVLASVDYSIVTLSQSPYEISKLELLSQSRNVLYVVGAYEQRNIFTVHNLQLLYPVLKGKCVMIPYYASLTAACCAGDAEQFLLRGMEIEETKMPLFFRKVKKAYIRWKRDAYAVDEEKEGTEAKGQTTIV